MSIFHISSNNSKISDFEDYLGQTEKANVHISHIDPNLYLNTLNEHKGKQVRLILDTRIEVESGIASELSVSELIIYPATNSANLEDSRARKLYLQFDKSPDQYLEFFLDATLGNTVEEVNAVIPGSDLEKYIEQFEGLPRLSSLGINCMQSTLETLPIELLKKYPIKSLTLPPTVSLESMMALREFPLTSLSYKNKNNANEIIKSYIGSPLCDTLQEIHFDGDIPEEITHFKALKTLNYGLGIPCHVAVNMDFESCNLDRYSREVEVDFYQLLRDELASGDIDRKLFWSLSYYGDFSYRNDRSGLDEYSIAELLPAAKFTVKKMRIRLQEYLNLRIAELPPLAKKDLPKNAKFSILGKLKPKYNNYTVDELASIIAEAGYEFVPKPTADVAHIIVGDDKVAYPKNLPDSVQWLGANGLVTLLGAQPSESALEMQLKPLLEHTVKDEYSGCNVSLYTIKGARPLNILSLVNPKENGKELGDLNIYYEAFSNWFLDSSKILENTEIEVANRAGVIRTLSLREESEERSYAFFDIFRNFILLAIDVEELNLYMLHKDDPANVYKWSGEFNAGNQLSLENDNLVDFLASLEPYHHKEGEFNINGLDVY